MNPINLHIFFAYKMAQAIFRGKNNKIFLLILYADLDKVVNHPQAENSELYNVLKLVRFATEISVSNVGVV